MKKTIVIFLLLPISLFAQLFDVTIKNGDPMSSMYLLNNRFFSPAEVEGIMGAICNPAGIESDKNFEIGVIWSFPVRIYEEINIPLDLNGTDVNLPVGVGVDQIGGVDIAGFSVSKGPFTMALGAMRGTLMGLDLGSSVAIDMELPTITLYDTLTHNDFEQIPDTVEIPIIEEVAGSLSLEANGDIGIQGGSSAKTFLLFSMGNKNISIGAGLKHSTRYIQLPGLANVQIELNPLVGTVTVDTLLDSTWTVSLEVQSSMASDSFLVFRALGGGQSAVTSYLGGVQIMAGPLRAGLSMEYTPMCNLGDSLFFSATYPTGIDPTTIVDTVNSDVVVDTVNHTITGYLRPASPSFTDTTITFLDGYNMSVASTFTIRGGVLFHLLFVYVGGSGSIDVLGNGNIGAGSMYGTFDMGMDFNILALRLNLMYRQPYYKIVIPAIQDLMEEYVGDVKMKGVDTYMGIPEFSGGLSVGINAGYATIDLGVRISSLSAVVGLLGFVDEDVDISKFISFGLGVRVKL